MKDITLVSHLNNLAAGSTSPAARTAPGFAQTFAKALEETVKAEAIADKQVEQFATGESKNLHEVMISLEKADISMRMMVQMRNKIVEAYQQIMRMQI